MNPTSTTALPEVALSESEQKIEALVQRYRASQYEDVDALIELTDLLPYSDGEPLETPWQFAAIALLKEVLYWNWRDRKDFFIGGDMFVYYSLDRLSKPAFRGPDFFYVAGAERRKHRDKWVVWTEGGRYPDLIIEFLSPSTANIDLTLKKELYEKVWKTAEYFCYDPDLGELRGWRLDPDKVYQSIVPDERGWMWSSQFQMWLGKWSGVFHDLEAVWLRPYDGEGQLILYAGEEAVRRAEAAEAEVARLRACLAELEEGSPRPPGSPSSPAPEGSEKPPPGTDVSVE